NGKAVEHKYAPAYYDKIGLGIDFTARDIQDECKSKGHPWEIAKAFDQSAAVSSFVDKSTLDMSSIKFQLLKNGYLAQDGNTKDLIFQFDYLISYISRYFTLQVGDLIFTGTPAGVGKVEIGDVYQGYLESTKLLECQIK
ncbi:MAG: fumarylacetoacetate hydrolase family protein, partial [Saprospiraceae bacterium]